MEVVSTSPTGFLAEDFTGSISFHTRLLICIRMHSAQIIANTWELERMTIIRATMLVVAGGSPDTCGIIAEVDRGETRYSR
jgi:hypothetical protein